jgi:hypothetical protein
MQTGIENKISVLILGALVLASAILFSKEAVALDDFDLYKYGDTKVVIERTGFVMKFVFYDNEDDLNKAFREATELPINDKGRVRAFTQTREGDDVCVIHIVPPEIWDDREALTILGHEALHCTYANHQDAAKETAQRDKDIKDKKAIITEDSSIEDLLAEDRRLELEWLRAEYKELGIIIDEDESP